MASRHSAKQRRRVFLGCEGESEQSYGKLLGQMTEYLRHPVHIDRVLLGAGGPLAMVETAVKRKAKGKRDRVAYAACAVLLDADTQRQSPSNTAEAEALARRHGLRLVWQEPCHEAILLRHLPGCDMRRPPTTAQALADLRRAWPDYRKGLNADALGRMIDGAAVLRAAASDPGLQAFLADIGFGYD